MSNICNESQSKSSDDYVPVGVLSQSDNWICQQGTHIFLLNPHRINEVVIYRRLLESFQFQTESLETPIDINECLLGDVNLWKTLLALETEQEKEMFPGYRKITDHRIIANGFHIVIFTEQGSSPEVKQVQLRAVADSIPTYGIGDLCEVLENIASLPESSSLSQSRPLKILNYLKGEAVRMARKSPLFSCREEIAELLESSKRLKTSECLHSRPFFQKLYDISSLPFSQTTFQGESQLFPK
ncbi:Hypothetical predicted protein [Octopus vulgaris]|uniref:PMS1 protein homolog 1-like n=1 Tax=Octopus vulgaris TaxID=6645 RepID=A0AA36BYN0_OCTVU|nr:Hypothetical predicted protein [Octopus vulgaris]